MLKSIRPMVFFLVSFAFSAAEAVERIGPGPRNLPGGGGGESIWALFALPLIAEPFILVFLLFFWVVRIIPLAIACEIAFFWVFGGSWMQLPSGLGDGTYALIAIIGGIACFVLGVFVFDYVERHPRRWRWPD